MIFWRYAWAVMCSTPRIGGLEKVVLQKQERVQHVAASGKHLAYYSPATKKVNYCLLGKRPDTLYDVFQKNCFSLSDLDVCEENSRVYVAMAHYSLADNDHSIDIAVIDPVAMSVHKYPFPMPVAHRTYIRKCSFVRLHGFFSLVSWSIDGTRSVHRVDTPRWTMHSFPFKVYHVSISEDTVGILDNDFVFHVFHPDGGYRNMTVDDLSLPVSACHFSVPAKQLTLGFPDGTLRVYRAGVSFSHQFHRAIRGVYGNNDFFFLFLDNGEVVVGDMTESLPVLSRWHRVFDPEDMQRYAYQPPYLVVDGDREGLVLRGWKPIPSEAHLMARIRAATAARQRPVNTQDRSDLDDFLKHAVMKYRNHTASATTASDNNSNSTTPGTR